MSMIMTVIVSPSNGEIYTSWRTGTACSYVLDGPQVFYGALRERPENRTETPVHGGQGSTLLASRVSG